MGFKGGNVLGTIALNTSTAGTTSIGTGTNTGTIAIGSTNSAAVSVDCGTAGITVGTTGNAHTSIFGSTNSTSATTLQSGSGALAVTSTNGTLTINSGTGALAISNDASATSVSFATGGAVKTVALGSTNSTSATTIQSGSTGISVTATNGPITINSGTGIIGISTDSTAATTNIAGGGGVKTLNLGSTNTTSITTVECGTGGAYFGTSANAHQTTVGSTNSTSATTINYGTGDFNIASATGNVMVAQDTGEINYPLQCSFFAINSATDTNATGDGTTYTIIQDTEIFDQNSDFNSSTGTFTAPVTGRYLLCCNVALSAITALFTTTAINIVTSNRSLRVNDVGAIGNAGGTLTLNGTFLCDMDVNDTATVTVAVSGSTKTISVLGNGTVPLSSFGGQLLA